MRPIRRSLPLLVAAAMPFTAGELSAGVIFEQDFSSSTNVADYVSSPADANEFDHIGPGDVTSSATVSITDGALQFSKPIDGTGRAGFLRATDFAGPPTLLSISFDVSGNNVKGNFAPGATLQIGDYNVNQNDYSGGSTAQRFAGILLRTRGSNAFWVEAGGNNSNSIANNTTATIEIFLNNSGSSASYTAPDLVNRILNDRAYTVFVDGVLLAENVAADGAGGDLTNMRLLFEKDGLVLNLDNIVIRDDLALIPEPASLALLLVGGGLVAFRRRA
jgi:hypothetical protein